MMVEAARRRKAAIASSALVLALGAALLCAPWRGHLDDTDSQLYQVVARNLAEDRAWLTPRYLPGVYPQYREHLPFGLWPATAAVRLLGEGALLPLNLCFSLGTLLLVLWLGGRLLGPGGGAAAGLILALCETFFLYGARPRLDPLLVLLSTAASVPLLLPAPRLRAYALAAALGALAALVKGPFGLVPLAAAGGAQALLWRAPRRLVWIALAMLAAALPVTAFLLEDRALGQGSWWRGYLHDQLLASAVGARRDGELGFFYPLVSVAGRFWPGLPLLLWAALGAVRRAFSSSPPAATAAASTTAEATRLLALHCALMLFALCLPTRKFWNHELVAYPALALLAGAGAAPLLQPVLARPRQARACVIGLASAAALAWALSLAGAGRKLLQPPCVASAELAPQLSRFPSGTELLLVSPEPDWRLIAALAAERRLFAWPVTSLTEHAGKVALVREEIHDSRTGWLELGAARGWSLLVRAEPAVSLEKGP